MQTEKTIEITAEAEEDAAEESVQLKDVTEDVPLPEEIRSGGKRRRRLVMTGALAGLLILTAAGGYFLLRGKKVEVRTSGRGAEKVTSGADLQKAAYESLSDALTKPVSPAASAAAANAGAGQTPAVAMAGVTPAPSVSPGPDSAAKPVSVQTGIAVTLAPPDEAQRAGNGGRNSSSAVSSASSSGMVAAGGNPIGNGVNGTSDASTTSSFTKPKTDASITFTSAAAFTSADFSGAGGKPSRNGSRRASMGTAAALTNVSDGSNVSNVSNVSGGSASLKSSESVSVVTDKNSFRQPSTAKSQAENLPPFGAMLPVRLLGVLYTLRTGALVRLELTRDVQAQHQGLRKGTIFVGAVISGELDRAFIQIRGYVDSETDRFVPLSADTLGSDGAAGLRGRKRRVSSAWLTVLDRAAQSGSQILSGVLGRQGSSVIIAADPYGTYRQASGDSRRQENRSFVEVPAGTIGFILITRLPETEKRDFRQTVANEADAHTELPDAELAELLTEADPERIRAALPRMTPELRRIAQMVLSSIEQ